MKLFVVLCIVAGATAAVLQERQLPPPPPTTIKPLNTTTRPPTTTARPATTTVKPATTTIKPATTTVKPATTTIKPATTTVNPATTTVKLATTTVKAANTTVPVLTTTVKAATTIASATTTAPSTTYSSYQQYLINKAKTLAAAGTCSSVKGSCTGNCTTAGTSLYYSWTDSTSRYVVVSGIPSHTFGSGAVKPNPNSACENVNYFKLPLNPIKGTTSQSSPMGPLAGAVTGAYIYNTLSAPDGSLAVPNEGTSLDSCLGHSDPTCRYHYHSEPTCVSNYNGGCVLLGYWYDGFPLYSYCPSKTTSSRMMTSCYSQTSGTTGLLNTHFTDSKTSSCDLDENNGYTAADGSYAYYMTSTYPWLPIGYFGTVAGKVCGV